MKNILVEDRSLYTPVRRYRRGSQEVTVIGMIHRGTSEYFACIQQEVDRHDFGFYESAKDDSGKLKVPEDSQFYFNYLKKGRVRARSLARHAGLIYQRDQIVYPDHWENPDLSLDEIAIKVSEREIKGAPGLRKLELDINSIAKKDPVAFERCYKSGYMLLFSYWDRKGVEDNDPIWDIERHNMLFSAMNRHDDNDDICVLYGVAHLLAIDRYLQQKGFQREGVSWAKVWEIRDDEPMLVMSALRMFRTIPLRSWFKKKS